MSTLATAFTLLALLQSSKTDTPGPAALAFVGVHVLPMSEERVLRDQTVLVEGERIVRVGPVGEVQVPACATRVEGLGRFLAPGLIDSHVHLMDEGDLLVYLANGVTTVRNLKGLPWHLELRERIARGEVLGPHLVTSGPFVNEPRVHTVEDVQRAVAEQLVPATTASRSTASSRARPTKRCSRRPRWPGSRSSGTRRATCPWSGCSSSAGK